MIFTVCFGPLLHENSKKESSNSVNSLLNENKILLDTPSKAWCADLAEQVYIHFDLMAKSLIRGIATQGYQGGKWTEAFYIGYSDNAITWFNHTRDDEPLVCTKLLV